MDVNSNSHAEQSRADSHVKDTRLGATAPSKEKKVTWQLHVGHPVGRPSFLALALTSLCAWASVPSLFSSPFFPPFLKQMETWLGVSLEISCSGFQNGCCVLCTAHNHRCRIEAFSPQTKDKTSRFSRTLRGKKNKRKHEAGSTFSNF